MSVFISCDQCRKRLKIPESVVGRAVKCPACGAVFKSSAAQVLSPPHHPAAPDDEAALVAPARQPALALDDDEEDRPRPRKKAALLDDEPAEVSPVRRADDDERPAKRRPATRADDEEDAEELELEDDLPKKKGKRRTPWYLMLPLLLLSFLGAALPWLWTVGFTFLQLDKAVALDFDDRVWVGVGSGVGVVLFCLIFSLLPLRAWLRFLLVFLTLGVVYGGSFAAVHWWKDLPVKQEKTLPANPKMQQGIPAAKPPGMRGPGGPPQNLGPDEKPDD